MKATRIVSLITIFVLGFTFFSTTAVPRVEAQGLSEYNRVPIPPINPKFVALEHAATAALDAGQYALAEYDARASTLSASMGEAQDDLASALLAQGKTKEAATVYAAILKPGIENATDVLPYALLLVREGEWAKALDVYEAALPHVGGGALPSPGGNALLSDDNDFSADTPQPVDLEVDIHIAMGFTGIDDYGISGPTYRDRALAEYREAVKLSPDSPLANLALARGLADDGREADATAAYQDVISRFSGDIKDVAEKVLGTYQYPAPTPTAK